MATRTFHDEKALRAAVIAEAKLAYRQHWGEPFHATQAQSLDVRGWAAAWSLASKSERQAQRHFAALKAALTKAVLFAEACKVAEPKQPLGGAAQILCDCAPTLVRTLDRVDRRRADAITVQSAEPLSRPRWMQFRLKLWYRDEGALRGAPRRELATLGLLGGWWPPHAARKAELLRGVTVANVFAWEGDLMDHARKRLLAGVDPLPVTDESRPTAGRSFVP